MPSPSAPSPFTMAHKKKKKKKKGEKKTNSELLNYYKPTKYTY
jgi:hypothetical protein